MLYNAVYIRGWGVFFCFLSLVKTMVDILGQIKKELEEIKEKLNDTDRAKKPTKGQF